eukprot:354406-Chlamydomonas_euryale.AAC.2
MLAGTQPSVQSVDTHGRSQVGRQPGGSAGEVLSHTHTCGHLDAQRACVQTDSSRMRVRSAPQSTMCRIARFRSRPCTASHGTAVDHVPHRTVPQSTMYRIAPVQAARRSPSAPPRPVQPPPPRSKTESGEQALHRRHRRAWRCRPRAAPDRQRRTSAGTASGARRARATAGARPPPTPHAWPPRRRAAAAAGPATAAAPASSPAGWRSGAAR